jgi:hypothetical protein
MIELDEERYRPTALPLQVCAAWEGREHTACLCCLSVQDVQLWLPSNIPVGTETQLRLEADDTQLAATMTAEWSTPTPDGFIIGFRLPEPLPRSMLEHLAARGRLERRNESRERVAIDVEIHVELEGRPQQRVRMIDYSTGGFCLQAASDIPPGKRLLVEREVNGTLVRIPARTAWQFKSADHVTVGCVLEQPLDATELKQIVEAASAVAHK